MTAMTLTFKTGKKQITKKRVMSSTRIYGSSIDDDSGAGTPTTPRTPVFPVQSPSGALSSSAPVPAAPTASTAVNPTALSKEIASLKQTIEHQVRALEVRDKLINDLSRERDKKISGIDLERDPVVLELRARNKELEHRLQGGTVHGHSSAVLGAATLAAIQATRRAPLLVNQQTQVGGPVAGGAAPMGDGAVIANTARALSASVPLPNKATSSTARNAADSDMCLSPNASVVALARQALVAATAELQQKSHQKATSPEHHADAARFSPTVFPCPPTASPMPSPSVANRRTSNPQLDEGNPLGSVQGRKRNNSLDSITRSSPSSSLVILPAVRDSPDSPLTVQQPPTTSSSNSVRTTTMKDGAQRQQPLTAPIPTSVSAALPSQVKAAESKAMDFGELLSHANAAAQKRKEASTRAGANSMGSGGPATALQVGNSVSHAGIGFSTSAGAKENFQVSLSISSLAKSCDNSAANIKTLLPSSGRKQVGGVKGTAVLPQIGGTGLAPPKHVTAQKQ